MKVVLVRQVNNYDNKLEYCNYMTTKKKFKNICDVDIVKTNDSIIVKTSVKWYKRIWYILSNPFLYIFNGKIRY